MSLDLEARLRVFFASAPQNIHPIQTLEIGHPDMTKTYHLWGEPYAGQTTTEASVVVDMEGANFTVEQAGEMGHLDQAFNINLDLTDIEDEFRREMDLVPIDTEDRVQLVYREYLSDDLTEPQAIARLEVESVSYRKGAATIVAISPRLNKTRTGELYVPKEIPMLRAFL